ncbi:MAG: hypothetical protein Q8O37_13720 [Sulfuricellaceae bacterium]|nr:hypothetical protein [Sulfuricellaceae bacterium]
MFSWKKLGIIFNPTISQPRPWMQEYAQCPTPFVLNEKVLRVYIACRPQRGTDMQYVSYPGYVDLARKDILRVVGVADAPLMPLGNPGSFDEFGIMPSSFVRRGDEVFTYYSGWTRMQSVPYTLAIGLAVSRDGGKQFEKIGEGPVLGLSLAEPYFVTGPVVRAIGDQWHMWYLTGRKWLFDGGKPEPVYQIARAKSSDGIIWRRDGVPIIPTLSEDECQDIFSPFFLGGKWHAIFAWRQPSALAGAYRLGYASSDDLETWVRDDAQAGIELSETGWDSQMMCYPQVMELDGRILMFYCGNAFGREGFGVAELTGYTVPT